MQLHRYIIMQKIRGIILLYFILVCSLTAKSQYTFRSGLNYSINNFDNSNTLGINYSIEHSFMLGYKKRASKGFINTQFHYISNNFKINDDKFNSINSYGMIISYQLQMDRHQHYCVPWPISPKLYFKKYIKVGINMEGRRFLNAEKTKLIAAPYIAAGTSLLIWKLFRLEIEGAASPDIYSVKINEHKIKSIASNLTLGIYMPLNRYL